MTKILHFGDVHYEEASGRLKAADGIDQGWHDVAHCVEQLVDRAIAEQVLAVAFGGDLAQNRRPSAQTNDHFAGQMGRLHAAGIPVVAIPGNHDIASNGEANALDPFAHLPGFELFNEPGIAWIEQCEETGAVSVSSIGDAASTAAIVCVPWLQRSVVAANLPAGTPLEEVLATMSAAAMAIVRELAAQVRDAGVPGFLLYHGTVSGGRTPSGMLADLFHEPVLPANELGALGLAGVMLNHLHKRQDLATADSCPIVYSSSAERLTFNDEGDPKGGALWTIPPAGEHAQVEFVDTDAREFVTVTGDSVMSDGCYAGAIVRARLGIRPDGFQHEPEAVRELLELTTPYRIASIEIEQPDQRVDHAAADVARTDPLEALATWIDEENPDHPLRSELLAAAAELTGTANSFQGGDRDAGGSVTPATGDAADDQDGATRDLASAATETSAPSLVVDGAGAIVAEIPV